MSAISLKVKNYRKEIITDYLYIFIYYYLLLLCCPRYCSAVDRNNSRGFPVGLAPDGARQGQVNELTTAKRLMEQLNCFANDYT